MQLKTFFLFFLFRVWVCVSVRVQLADFLFWKQYLNKWSLLILKKLLHFGNNGEKIAFEHLSTCLAIIAKPKNSQTYILSIKYGTKSFPRI